MKCRRLQDLVSWSDLPEHLLQLVLMRLRIGDYIIFRRVCAAWRATARCLHSPLLMHSSIPDEGTQIFFCPLDYRNYRLNLPGTGINNNYEYLGCFHGWLLVNPLDPRMRYTIFFFNPFTAARINLPAYDIINFYDVKLSSAPTDPKCIVIITGAEPGFKFCRIGDNEWTEEEFGSPLLDIALTFREKLYLLFYRSPSNTESTILTSNIAKYFKLKFLELHPLSFNFREHILFLVESLGDILLVVKRSSTSVMLVSFVVFRLDLSTSSWVETKNIGDRVLFLGNHCSASFTATELGCKENQIYFIVLWKAGWGVFDIEDGSCSMTSYLRSSTLLSRVLPEQKHPRFGEKPMWITPCFD